MLILILAQKVVLGDNFGRYDTKIIILRRFLAKRLLEIALPWQHKKLFERVCNMLKPGGPKAGVSSAAVCARKL